MDIKSILDRASKLKIAVIGDLIIDSYIYGNVERISPEAPVPVVLKKETKETMGGAGNVYMNLANLGVDAELYCNFQGEPIWPEQEKIYTNNFPHAKKTRVMCGNHHLLRIDDELEAEQIEWYQYNQFSWWEQLMSKFDSFDAIVIADYGKGVVSESLINTIIDFKNITLKEGRYIPVIVDAKKDFHRYQYVDILKCNKREWEARPSGMAVKDLHVDNLIVTCGESGISFYDHQGNGDGIDGIPVNIVDVCGAGDTVTAVLAMVMGINDANPISSIETACELANFAAAEVCKRPGVYAIQKQDLEHYIFPIYENTDSVERSANADSI